MQLAGEWGVGRGGSQPHFPHRNTGAIHESRSSLRRRGLGRFPERLALDLDPVGVVHDPVQDPSSKTSPNQAPSSALFPITNSKPPTIESGILEIEIARTDSMAEICLKDADVHHKLAYTFMEQTQTEGHAALALCIRYLATANRDFDRAIRTFYLMKENRLAPEELLQAQTDNPTPQKLSTPNEPTPKRPPIRPEPATTAETR